MHDVFLIHAQQDTPIADAVRASLEQRGIRCWSAGPGEARDEAAQDALSTARVAVLIFTSYANESRAVHHEVESAVRLGKPVVGLQTENLAPAAALDLRASQIHWVAATNPPVQAHLDALGNTIEQVAKNPQPAPGGPMPGAAGARPSSCGLKAVLVGVGCLVLIVALAIAGIGSAIMLPSLSRAREAARRASCQNNLKQMGLVCKMWAGEHDGAYPSLSPEPGKFMCTDAVFPEYITDPFILVCPSDSDPIPAAPGPQAAIDDHSYFYLGYLVRDRQEAELFLDAYRAQLQARGVFETDLELGGQTLYKLSDAPMDFPEQAEIPIMFDRSLEHHMPAGINVLYMDGHVEFLRMDTKFPAEQWFLDALDEIEMELETGP
jgi:prepilin-type processing-associated H-X9-DG protein